MGHCLHQLLLIYRPLCYHGKTLMNRARLKLIKNDTKPNEKKNKNIFIKFSKIDMEYEMNI